jgi:chromosome segregation ATPase
MVVGLLQENHITDMAGLKEKVSEMYGRQVDLGDRLNRIDRRLKTLDEHIRQAGYYHEHREIYSRYRQLKPRGRKKFFEEHRADLMMFEDAKRYLDAHLNGHALPLRSWKEEREKLTAERALLNRQSGLLKEEVKKVETMRWTVENIIRGAAPRRNRMRGRER